MGHRRQRASRHQSGACLVDDRDHEDRSRRAEVARPRRRPERVRRLSRGRRDRLPHRISRVASTGCGRRRSTSVLPTRSSAPRSRSCWCATRASTSGWRPRRMRGRRLRSASGRSSFSPRSSDRNLFAASQAGLVNNLNDGMSWGIFPLFFASFGLARRADRHTEGGLSGDLGHPAGRHRSLVRPLGPQGPDRRRHVGAGRGLVPDRGRRVISSGGSSAACSSDSARRWFIRA